MPDSLTICAHCGTDLRNGRRFKDAAGRLFCPGCAEKFRAKPPAAAAPDKPRTRDPDDGTIALADEPDPRPRPPAKSRYADLELCPDCGTPFGSGPVCLSCGHDRRTGDSIGVNVPGPAGEPPVPKSKRPPKPCSQCGYDLRGLKTARCPECGTINKRLNRGQKSEKETLREMYLKPLLMIAIGVAVVLLLQFVLGAALGGGAGTGGRVLVGGKAALGYLILFPIVLVIGFFAYILCSVIFIGFDEPLGVTFVRLGAVYAITDAVEAVVRPIPVLGWVAWLIAGTVYLGLLMSLMELDLEDAWLVAGITFIAKVIVGVALFALLSGLF